MWAIALLFLAACVGGRVFEQTSATRPWRERQGERHEWWSARGLVIPHASFPADCRLCHVEGQWSELRADFEFDHLRETGVALTGAHTEAQCLRCHNDRGPAGEFAQRGCAGCHLDVHQGRRGSHCESCHTQQDWNVDFDLVQHARSRFPLVGAHAAAVCRDCHVDYPAAQLAVLDTACVSCHLQDLERALDPDHRALGWTAACDRCHQVSTFGGAGFLHPGFPLNGGHAALDCSACHSGGTFTGTPTACFACHADDYAAATDPDHTGLGFPTTCQDCHSTSTWSGATFQHPWFPISSGPHRNFDCNDCHLVPGNSSSFSCTHCHEHRQSEMDDEHEGVGGYTWLSSACYQCHPNGQEHARSMGPRRPKAQRRPAVPDAGTAAPVR